MANSYMGHLLLSTPSKRKTDRARFEKDEWPTPTWGPLFLSTPSKRKTDRARREGDGWPLPPWFAIFYKPF